MTRPDVVATWVGRSSPAERPQVEERIKIYVDQLKATGYADGSEWAAKHGLSSLESDENVLHNIPWRPGFDSVVFTVRAIRSLIPARFAPPLAAFRREHAPFRIGPIAGRGLGLLATRAIPAGVPVLVEAPSLVLPFMSLGATLRWGLADPRDAAAGYDPSTLPGDLHQAMFARVDPGQKQALLALCNCKPPGQCGVEEGIIRTNAFDITLRAPKGPETFAKHRAIFLEMSRANHSCSQNLGYWWDVDSFTMTVFTRREVKESEELTMGYLDGHMPWAERQARLKGMYLFDCACTACSKTVDARAKSDKRRAEIATLWRTLDVMALAERWSVHTGAGWRMEDVEREFIRPLKKGYDLYVKENLSGNTQPRCAHVLMVIYPDMGDVDAAVMWAKRAAQAWMVRYWYGEKDSTHRAICLEHIQECKALVDHPPKHRVK